MNGPKVGGTRLVVLRIVCVGWVLAATLGAAGCVLPVPPGDPAATPAAQAPPRILYFRADKSLVVVPETAVLEWRTENAATVTISGIGTVAGSGSREVDPSKSAGPASGEFTLTASAADGTSTAANVRFSLAYPSMTGPQGPAATIATPRPIEVLPRPAVVAINPCAAAVQGKVAWDYRGTTRWSPTNVATLCAGSTSPAPAQCFDRVMHGGVNWGGGTRWKWQNALALCAGSQHAGRTIACFERALTSQGGWQQATAACKRQ